MHKAEVDVWTVDLCSPRDIFLTAEEQARAARFKFPLLSIRWSRTRSALRSILAQYLNRAPLDLVFTHNPHGKPLLPEIHFNLSHADDFAMIAVSRTAPVGIDIERFRPNVDLALLLERLGEGDLPQDKDELHRRWTRREAASKTCGGALFETPDPDVHIVDLKAPVNHFASLGAWKAEPAPTYRESA